MACINQERLFCYSNIQPHCPWIIRGLSLLLLHIYCRWAMVLCAMFIRGLGWPRIDSSCGKQKRDSKPCPFSENLRQMSLLLTSHWPEQIIWSLLSSIAQRCVTVLQREETGILSKLPKIPFNISPKWPRNQRLRPQHPSKKPILLSISS